MAFARTAAVAGLGTLTCAGNTTVTIAGSSFAFGIGGAPSTTTVRVGSTITVGGNTRTVISIQSSSSLTVDTAFPAFTAQAYTTQTGIIQTGTDTLTNTSPAPTGFIIREDRGGLMRLFDVQGLDLFTEGTLTVQSWGAQLRNDGSCSNRFEVIGSVNGGEIIISGRKSTANNGPFPYVGFDWLGQNGQKIMKLRSTNATYPAKFTIIDAAVRWGADWLTTDSGNFSRITTQGDECWILCARGSGTQQARIRQDNTTATIDFQTTKETWVGMWLNFGVPQLSLKGYTPIDTDGPEINLASVPSATRIPLENYNTTYVVPNYYAGAQIVLLGGAWVRLIGNLRGTNIVWMSSSASGRNVIEFSKKITIKAQDTAGNLLSDGYMYYQPVGSNVGGVRAKGGTSDITFDLSQQNIPTVGGAATAEFPYAWGYNNANGNQSVYNYFCTGTTKGAETHLIGSSRYGFDKVYLTTSLSGNNDVTPTFVHTSLPTSSKVIATAAAISGIAFNFTTKVMTITGNLTYQQIYDAYQYALNQTANLFQADNCLTVNGISNYVGWTINVATGVTLSTGTGNFTTLKANTITLTGTAKITGVYSDTTGTSTVLTISGFGANSAVYVEDNNAVQKYFNADVTGSVVVYIPPTAIGSWYYAVEKFGNQRQSDFFTFSGGQKAIVVKELPDNKILLTKAQTLALTTADNPDETYDAFALLRLDLPYISFGQIVSKDGATLYGSDYDIIIDADAENVVEADYDTKVITIKSALFEAGPVCNLVKLDFPKTVTANATEVINVNIEDNNGDSTTEIKGVSGSLVDVWKCTNGTLNVDYATGTKIAENIGAGKYRFIHQDGFKLIFFDKDTLMARDCSMSKGTYTLGWFVYDDERGGLNQNQSDKFETIYSKVDVIDDNVVSVKGTVEGLSASTGVTEAEIIAMGLAKEATSEEIKTKVEAIQTFNAEELMPTVYAIQSQQNVIIDDQGSMIKAIQSANENFNPVTDSLSAISDAIDILKTLVEDKTGYSLTTEQVEAIAVAVEAHLLDEGDNQMLINAIVGAIGNTNIDETVLVSAIRADIERADGMLKAVKTKADTLINVDISTLSKKADTDLLLKAADYVAPDNAKIVQIKTKVDTLNNADFTTTNNKIDAVKTKVDTLENADLSVTNDKIDALAEASSETTPATIKAEIKPMLDKLNEGLQLLSEFEPYEGDLPN